MPDSNKAKVLAYVSLVVGFLAILDLVFAWGTYGGGRFMGKGADFYFFKSIVLLLVAIWLKLGAIYHKK